MIQIHYKFQSLVTSEDRYKVITGGRASMKSYSTATLILLESDKDDGTILYTRYTLTNAEQSIMPEFQDKIDELGWHNKFHKSGNDLINLESGGRIMFRGIKTSNGINTAALKSIPKLKMWVNDESEELVDEKIFDTIDLSIRDNNYKLQVWLILNPSDVNHFIYRKFFKGNGVSDVWNGSKNNVTYVHTTYLENKHLPRGFADLAEKCKAEDIDKYNNIYLGRWRKLSEGNIYHNWEQIEDKDYPIHLDCWYGVDWGFANDPMAIVRLCFDADTHTIFAKELCYEKGRLTSFAADVIRKDILNRRTLLYQGEDWKIVHFNGKCWIGEQSYTDSEIMEDGREKGVKTIIADDIERRIVQERLGRLLRLLGEVYCDPARPEQIYEMRTQHNINSVPATNTDKVGRIEYLKYFNVKYVGENLREEYENYKWLTDKKDTSIYINKPQDGGDHLLDSMNYGAVTHLRRLGVSNKIGEN